MQNYENVDVYTRTWDHLVDLESGQTLRLAPNEATTEGVGIWTPQTKTVEVNGEEKTQVDPFAPALVVDLPDDFEDTYLKPTGAAAPASAAAKTPAPPKVTTPAPSGANQTEAAPSGDADTTPKE